MTKEIQSYVGKGRDLITIDPTQLRELNDKLNFVIGRFPQIAEWRTNYALPRSAIVTNIVVEGFTSKFCVHDPEKVDQLKREALIDWMAYDRSLDRSFEWETTNPDLMSAITRKLQQTLIGERELTSFINTGCETGKFYLDFDDAWPGPGESFFTSRGRVAPVDKYSGDISVTPECVELLTTIIYGSDRLKAFLADEKNLLKYGDIDHPGFRVLLLEAMGYSNGELRTGENRGWLRPVRGNRFSSVPKNNEKRRPICIEPLGNSICQRMIGRGIRRCLFTLGNDLDDGAARHHELLRGGGVATLDLKNASDSITLSLAKRLFPEPFYKLLCETRSPYTLVDQGGEKLYYQTKKLSSMGNGYTFELMSLILLTSLRESFRQYCKQHSITGSEYAEAYRKISVFGDDIVVPTFFYKSAIKTVEWLGFTVNVDKSFDGSRVTESCGLYVVDGQEVLRFDFREIEDLTDCIVWCNKLTYLIQAHPELEITETLERMRRTISNLIPLEYSGPIRPVLKRDEHGRVELPPWPMRAEGLQRSELNMQLESVWCLKEPTYMARGIEQVLHTLSVDHHPDIKFHVGIHDGRAPVAFVKGNTDFQVRAYLCTEEGEILASKRQLLGKRRKKGDLLYWAETPLISSDWPINNLESLDQAVALPLPGQGTAWHDRNWHLETPTRCTDLSSYNSLSDVRVLDPGLYDYLVTSLRRYHQTRVSTAGVSVYNGQVFPKYVWLPPSGVPSEFSLIRKQQRYSYYDVVKQPIEEVCVVRPLDGEDTPVSSGEYRRDQSRKRVSRPPVTQPKPVSSPRRISEKPKQPKKGRVQRSGKGPQKGAQTNTANRGKAKAEPRLTRDEVRLLRKLAEKLK